MNKIEIRQSIMPQPWPLVLAAILFLLPLSIYLISENGGINWGEEFIGVLFTSVFSSVTVFWAMGLKSHVILEKDTIQYQASPFSRSLKRIAVSSIKSWDIKKYKLGMSRGLGFKRDLRGNKYYVMRFGKVLELQTHAGYKIVFGLDKPELVDRFIQNNWQTEK